MIKKKEMESQYKQVMEKNAGSDPVATFFSELDRLLRVIPAIVHDAQVRQIEEFTAVFGPVYCFREWLDVEREMMDKYYKIMTETEKEFSDIKGKMEDIEIQLNDFEEKKQELIDQINGLTTKEFKEVKEQIDELASTINENV